MPWRDMVLVFGSPPDRNVAAGGWSVSTTFGAAMKLPPTFIPVAPDGTGRLAPRVVTGDLDGQAATFTFDLAEGKALLSLDESGAVGLVGDADALAVLAQAGGVTLLSDGIALRAYPGAPETVVALGDGTCTEPFHMLRTSDQTISLEPMNACSKELWLAPIASRGHDLAIAKDGLVMTSTQFRASALTPARVGTILTREADGSYTRAVAPSGVAVDVATKQSFTLYETIPLFSVPVAPPPLTVPADAPVYVFHQKLTEKSDDVYPPRYPPTDVAWGNDDTPDRIYVPPCDPSVPVPTIWGDGITGSGARPAHATAIQDLHGARWTYYADTDGRLIRTVNHETGASRWMEYDPAGRVTGVLEPDGARQCLRYDDVGNLAEVLSLPAWQPDLPVPAPIRQRFGWTAPPVRLETVMDPRDPTRVLRRHEYDSRGNVLAVVEIDGTRTSVTPVGGTSAARSMPASIVGPDGAVTRVSYDLSNGTVRTVTRDATGASPVTMEVQSDDAGRPTWSTSPLGLIETLEWDGPELAARTWDADGLLRTERYTYDGDAQLETVTRDRQQVSYRYDVTGGLRSTAQIALDASLPAAIRCQRVAPGGRVLEEVSAEGSRVRYAYDGEGRVTSVEVGDLGPSAEAWDDACLDRPTGASTAGRAGSFEYDTSGRRVAAVDGRGLRTTWQYDGFGRPIVERRPDGSQVWTGYDIVGQVVWQAAYSAAPSPLYRAPLFGEPGLLAAVELHYDLRGRLDEARRWHFDSQGTAIGDGVARTAYSYDEVARTVTVTDDLGRITRSRADGAGRSVELRLPDGSVVATAFLDGGRTVRTTRPSIGGTIVETSTLTATGAVAESSVIAAGMQRSMGTAAWLDPLLRGATVSATGVITTPTYDAFERLSHVRTELPGGGGETLKLAYDRDGRLVTRMSDAGMGDPGATWDFTYDALGRLIRETDPAGAATVTAYIGVTGLVEATTDPRQVRTSNTYAPAGWLQQASVDTPTGTDVLLDFHHDALGRMTSAMRQDGGQIPARNQFTWDSLGNLRTESDDVLGAATTRSHVHDGLGQRVRTTIGALSATRSFDPLGRQTALIVNGDSPATATWAYGAVGGPVTRTLKNGVESRYGYDALERLTSISDWRSGGRLASYEWEVPLDGVPRRLAVQQGALGVDNRAFAIDGAGRLTAEQAGTSASFQLGALDAPGPATQSALAAMTPARTSYDLDGRNNWLTRTTGGSVTTYGHDARDALTSIGGAPVATDAAGAITRDATQSYGYDALGLLAEVRPNTGGGRIYRRDALGRIVGETDIATGATTRFGYDGAQRVLVQEPSGATSTTFTTEGLDAPVVTLGPNGARQYYHQDRQGSVYGLTDATGQPTRWISYTAYGEPTLRDPGGQILDPTSALNGFGYHGLPHDVGLGLVDMRARAYLPTLGRFLSPDPIALAGGANLFAFVDSGPLAWRDPLGLAKLRDSLRLSPTLANGTCGCGFPSLSELARGALWDHNVYAQIAYRSSWNVGNALIDTARGDASAAEAATVFGEETLKNAFAGSEAVGGPVLGSLIAFGAGAIEAKLHGEGPPTDLALAASGGRIPSVVRVVLRNITRDRPEKFIRYMSEAEGAATVDAGGLVLKPTPSGGFHRNEKWIADARADMDASTLGDPRNFTHVMHIDAQPGTREWLRRLQAKYPDRLVLKSNEPGRYGIPWQEVSDFNGFIRAFTIGPRK